VLFSLFVICVSCYSVNSLSLPNRAGSHNTRNTAPSCPVATCANADQTCLVSITNAVLCLQSFCNITTISDTEEYGICTSLFPNGQSCFNDFECVTNNCIDLICEPLVGQQALASCTTDSNCFSGICKSGVCEGVAIGKSCTDSGDCVLNSYCLNGTCVAAVGLNQDCSTSECQYSYACVPTTSSGDYKCVLAYSVPAGGYCDPSAGGTCEDGLACVNNGNSVAGNCTAVPNSSLKSCNISSSNSSCDANEACTCDILNGKGICLSNLPPSPVGLSSAFKAVVNCLNSKCSSTSFESCLVSICSSTFCTYYNLLVNLDLLQLTYPSCYLNSIYQETPFGSCLLHPSTGSSLVIPVITAMIVPLLLSLIF